LFAAALPAVANKKAFPRGSKTEPEKLESSTKSQKGIAKVANFFRIAVAIMKTAVTEHPSTSKSPTEFSKLKKLKITIMKSMKNFAAQRLSKKEMNDVKGGAKVSCDLMIGEDIYNLGEIESSDYREVQQRLQEAYGDIGTIECQPWLL
jgi:hypothetical protein